MKPPRRYLLSALIFAVALPVFGRAADGPGIPPAKRLSVEIFGGFSLLNPRDLNLWADYENGYLDYTYRQKYDYNATLKRGYYSYSRTPASPRALASLKGGFPLGARIVYDLGRTVSVVLGVEFVSGSKSSGYSVQYEIRDVDPDKVRFLDAFLLQIDYPTFRLAVRAWVPQAGIRARLNLGRRAALAGQITGGWIFARAEAERESTTTTRDVRDFWQSTTIARELQGTGNGFAAEAAGQARISIFRRLEAIVEAGYAFRRTSKLAGSYSYYYRREDANSDPYESRLAYPQGTWRTYQSRASNAWGWWDYPNLSFFPEGAQGSDQTKPFRLDLSGFQFRAGLAWRF